MRRPVRSAVLGKLRALRARQEVELRSVVAEAVAAGVPSHDIAEAVGVGRSTLWRRYGTELRRDRGGGGGTDGDLAAPAPGVSRRSPRS